MLWVARCSLDTEVPDESGYYYFFLNSWVVDRSLPFRPYSPGVCFGRRGRAEENCRSSFQVKHPLFFSNYLETRACHDLCSSYADGRYREQKFRLKRCGISQVLYLIEGKASTPDLSFFIEDATIATQVEDGTHAHLFAEHALSTRALPAGFFIVRTENERDTASFLVHLANFDALGKDITLKRQQASVTKTLQEAHTRITTTIPTKSAKHNPSTGEGQFMTFKEFSKRVRFLSL